jgi:anaerobic glycerol-3-phosphate dehydrogenase
MDVLFAVQSHPNLRSKPEASSHIHSNSEARVSASRLPWIVEAALKNRRKQFVIDGEAVILGVDGRSDFNALHSRKHNHEVQLCAFDVLAIEGEDLRALPLSMRKTNLDRLLRGRPDGIFINPFEVGAIGPDLSRPPAVWGLRGWFQSAQTGHIAEGGRRTGSR